MSMNRNRVTGLDLAVARELRAEIARQPDISVSAIALALGMRRATLSARLNAHVPFSPSLMHSVAGLLGTSAAEITSRAQLALGIERRAS